jgi:hypothetical protein
MITAEEIVLVNHLLAVEPIFSAIANAQANIRVHATLHPKLPVAHRGRYDRTALLAALAPPQRPRR